MILPLPTLCRAIFPSYTLASPTYHHSVTCYSSEVWLQHPSDLPGMTTLEPSRCSYFLSRKSYDYARYLL